MKWKAHNLSELPFTPGCLLLAKERIERSYEVSDTGCWEWTKGRTKKGYGKTWLRQGGVTKNFIAHRLYYQLVRESVPDTLVLNHKCNNPPCINPDHMEVMTQKENNLISDSLTAVNAKKTHCLNGHEFTPENTGVYTKTGWRYCRTCSRRRTNRRASERTLEYHSRGLNSKGLPMSPLWKKKLGL